MARPVPLLIDCDPGIDDALALALAVLSPEVALLGVTTVAGNGPVELTTRNALRVLAAVGGGAVPVAAGAPRALVRTVPHHLPPPHGSNGVGGVDLPEAGRRARPEHAVDFLAGVLAAAEPRSVTVAAIGPLTNIALLLALHPELADRIDRLVVMAGSMSRGNITPVAEFNVWTDPEAAHRVLAGSGLDVCLVGLDVTRRATIDKDALAALSAGSERGRILSAMVAGYATQGADGWPMHDVLAVASVVDPTLVSTVPTRVEVDTGYGPARGQTVHSLDTARGAQVSTGLQGETFDSPTRAQVAVDVDVSRFRQLLLSRLAAAQ